MEKAFLPVYTGHVQRQTRRQGLLVSSPHLDTDGSLVRLLWRFGVNQRGHREDNGCYKMLPLSLSLLGRKESIRHHDLTMFLDFED